MSASPTGKEHLLSAKSAVGLLVIAAVLWSSGGVLIKLVSLPSIAIVGWRSFIAAGVIFCYLRHPKLSGNPMQLRAAVAYALTVFLFVIATKLTTAANAVLLQYSSPIWTALLGALFFKEHPKKSDWIVMVVVCSGMCLFFMDQLQPGDIAGNAIAIVSGVTLALFALFMRAQKGARSLDAVFFGNIIAVAMSLPVMIRVMPTTSDFLGLLLLGVFQLGISYILLSIAIRYLSALQTMLICTIEPILNPLWVAVGVGEIPGGWAIVGGAIVVGALLIRAGSASINAPQTVEIVPDEAPV